jgi:hypothetical protein
MPLDAVLHARIRDSAVTWGIETDGYADPDSYAARERAWAEGAGCYRTWVPPPA